ncbi:MAG TPA: GNAT family N-acetyltransferase [Gemmataceae bacterium]|nr:GNAT family N-acetyltransferase [Gemmataceae bacterium]
MPTTYFKRYRMERELSELHDVPELSAGFAWVAWGPGLIEAHAQVLFHSFHDSLDSVVFPNLGQQTGCAELMRAISSRSHFAPEATWLIVGPAGPCGSVQGVRDRWHGAIQNLGVAPEHRGRGLGELLLLKALLGFRRAGLGKAYLEVTARNDSAIRLYRRVGFRNTRTIYKMVPVLAVDEEVVI